ncbi:MAG: glycosyltransferase, partial [Verrucomicrobiales bacterium]
VGPAIEQGIGLMGKGGETVIVGQNFFTREDQKNEVGEAFRLDPAKPVLLVMGGSQGAKRLNDLAAESAALLPADLQILHIAGTADLERIQTTVGNRANYRVVGFCDKMALAYAASDLIIARSGASSLTEIAHAGLPSILVPYPHAADDHQTKNAVVFADAGAAELAQERDLDAASFVKLASGILNDLQTHGRMAKAARELDVPDASARICDAIEATLS